MSCLHCPHPIHRARIHLGRRRCKQHWFNHQPLPAVCLSDAKPVAVNPQEDSRADVKVYQHGGVTTTVSVVDLNADRWVHGVV